MEPTFDPRIEAILKQSKHPVDLDLRSMWLLDCQSTMDLACNKSFLTNICVSKNTMRIASNGGTLTTNKQGSWPGYQKRIWYSQSVITNIVALKNVKEQYRVTYDSNDEYFVVHRESEGKPNILFRMHPCGLHYFDPRDQDFMFISTVAENKKDFTKWQIASTRRSCKIIVSQAWVSVHEGF